MIPEEWELQFLKHLERGNQSTHMSIISRKEYDDKYCVKKKK